MADKQETSNRGGKSGVNLPLVVLGIITEIYSHARAKTAENHQRQTNENALVRSAKRTSAATIWIAIFGLCTVAAALAQIIVFYFQWRELNRSNDINWRVLCWRRTCPHWANEWHLSGRLVERADFSQISVRQHRQRRGPNGNYFSKLRFQSRMVEERKRGCGYYPIPAIVPRNDEAPARKRGNNCLSNYRARELSIH